jgi:hypothetical protein
MRAPNTSRGEDKNTATRACAVLKMNGKDEPEGMGENSQAERRSSSRTDGM